MKDYLVSVGNFHSLVLAKDAKDAINQVWEKEFVAKKKVSEEINALFGVKPNQLWDKSDLQARSLGSLHNEHGKIIKL